MPTASIIGLILSGLYLLNFTVGIFELPDNLLIVGNQNPSQNHGPSGLRRFSGEILDTEKSNGGRLEACRIGFFEEEDCRRKAAKERRE